MRGPGFGCDGKEGGEASPERACGQEHGGSGKFTLLSSHINLSREDDRLLREGETGAGLRLTHLRFTAGVLRAAG